MQDWIKIGVAAAILKLPVSTIRRQAAQGKIPCAMTPGGTRLFDPHVMAQMARAMQRAAQEVHHAHSDH